MSNEDLSFNVSIEEVVSVDADIAAGIRHDYLVNRSLPDQHPIGAITNLQASLDTLQDNIDTEAATRASADFTLQGNINTEIQNRIAAINAEALARTNADTALQNSVNTINNTLSTYGDIVTHDVSEFATAAQGALADSAIQPGDNISELVNDEAYIKLTSLSSTATGLTYTNTTGVLSLTSGYGIPTTTQIGLINTSLQPEDIVNNVTTTAINVPLSANMGKELQDQINNLKARGRFLALWNCATGLAESDPTTSPRPYNSGDYFIVGTVATSPAPNYRPDGTQYVIGQASTTVETVTVNVDDVYYYDGEVWKLQVNTRKEVTFASIAGQPTDNTNLAGALNLKANDSSVVHKAETETISGTKTFTGNPIFQGDAFNNIINVKRNHATDGAGIKFSNNSGTIGEIGIDSTKVPIHRDQNGANARVLVRGGTNASSAVGSTTTPVYIDANGVAQTITSYSGNANTATSATKATQDANGNVITTYYQPKLVSGTNIRTINSNTLLSSGNIEIKLSNLPDTNISSPTSGQFLSYDSTTQKWKNTTSSATVAFADITGQPTDNTNLATALSAKATDTAVVHKEGAETVSGTKTFTGNPVFQGSNWDNSLTIKRNTNSGASIKFINTTGNLGTIGIRDTGYPQFMDASSNAYYLARIPYGSAVGSTTKPVYIDANGTATALNYTIEKSVPSNAVFTDTNTKVTQTVSTTNAEYPILAKDSNATTTTTATSIFAAAIKINPSTGNVTATKFTGALVGNVTGNCSGSSGSCTGNAATATKLGTSTVGSTTQPVYLNAGTATVCNTMCDLASAQTITGVKTFSGNPKVTGTNFILQHQTDATPTQASQNPKITFNNVDASQSMSLVYTDYDSYEGSDSLTLVSNQSNPYFVAPHLRATTALHLGAVKTGPSIQYNSTTQALDFNFS